jgi:hypothetical protein
MAPPVDERRAAAMSARRCSMVVLSAVLAAVMVTVKSAVPLALVSMRRMASVSRRTVLERFSA